MRKLTKKSSVLRNSEWVIGVDEAGRGPLAGPVTVGAVAVRRHGMPIIKKLFGKKGIRDSKKMSCTERESLFLELRSLQKRKLVRVGVASCGPALIDSRGITFAVSRALFASVFQLSCNPNHCEILLDGLLHAPAIYKKQKTIIKGDETMPVIALASVVAKVTRDRKMIRLAKKYPGYGFEVHKGYGTRLHITVLKTKGITTIHRHSFIKGLV